ncbi:LysR substrate-binding domain-containing protein [Oceanimonas doudoroffii]|uniref:HTH lysR-type domain-containing protein n=1 Tax=Oceanimonas doudoroffii TaxID=84158 RepID=A0A233RIH8_9GAMM|nr:LysR substrate-binding domain-containing protein [Oceanimonas doudoroffii]OXY83193.1 hypothetical protein B6S08_06775 [Oceanimonas doudoroffii]
MKNMIGPDRTLVQMPSLTALKAFSAAAKYSSFTRAAEALCVSQAAISRQVRDLEENLNTQLFNRLGKALELTIDGEILYKTVEYAFNSISYTSNQIKSKNSKKNTNQLVICTTPSFSTLWMANNLPDFRSRHPDVDICLISIDDFNSIDESVYVDAFISPGMINNPDFNNIALFYDTIYPVCSPEYIEEHPGINTLSDLCSHPLIHLNSIYRVHAMEEFDWSSWFKYFDVNFLQNDLGRANDLTSNSYQFVIQMALDSHGIALGWKHLTENLESRGKLIRPLNNEIIFPERKHYLSYSSKSLPSQALKKFEDWVLDKFY